MNEGKIWIVEWDVPVKPGAARRKFYRQLWKLRDTHEDHGHQNTLSVLITKDQCLAQDVFNLAKQFGRTAIYEARLIDHSTGPFLLPYVPILNPWTPQ